MVKTHMYYVKVRVLHEGKPLETRLVKGYKTDSDHSARRFILNELLNQGYQVVDIDPYPK